MDILERLLKYDVWTTRHLLERCRELTEAQFDQEFDIGHRTLRKTWVHVIGNMEVWTDLIYERPVQEPPKLKPYPELVDGLMERLDTVGADLSAIALKLAAEGRLNECFVDVLDQPPVKKTFGGAIAHLVIHSAQHRNEILHILQRLGVQDLIEGDVLSWEQRERNTC